MQIGDSFTFIQSSVHDCFSLTNCNLVLFVFVSVILWLLWMETLLHSVLQFSHKLWFLPLPFFNFFCFTFSVFKAYCLWVFCLPLSTSMFLFHNLPILFVSATNFRCSWLRTELLYWRSFIILTIVSSDSSLVGAMFPYNQLKNSSWSSESAVF